MVPEAQKLEGSMMTIKATQMPLRHSRIGTTSDVYTHLDGELLKETAELLAAGITGSMASDRVQ